jgi:deoxyribodipyrimidine photo-lyase
LIITGQFYNVFSLSIHHTRWIEIVAKNPKYAQVNPAPQPQVRISSSLAKTIEDLTIPIPESVETHTLSPVLRDKAIARFPPGEQAAFKRLEEFAQTKILKYKEARDFPDLEGTSALSPYLAIGLVSARQCLAKARAANGGKMDSGKEGVVVWISEVGNCVSIDS